MDMFIDGSIDLSTESCHVNSFQGFPVADHCDNFVHIAGSTHQRAQVSNVWGSEARRVSYSS